MAVVLGDVAPAYFDEPDANLVAAAELAVESEGVAFLSGEGAENVSEIL